MWIPELSQLLLETLWCWHIRLYTKRRLILWSLNLLRDLKVHDYIDCQSQLPLRYKMGYTFSTLLSPLTIKTHTEVFPMWTHLLRFGQKVKICVYWFHVLANLSSSVTLLEKVAKKSLGPACPANSFSQVLEM